MAWKRPATTIDVSFVKGTPPKIPYELGLLLVGVQTSIKEKIELGKLKDATISISSDKTKMNFVFDDAPDPDEKSISDLSLEEVHKILNASYGYNKGVMLDIPVTPKSETNPEIVGRKLYFTDGTPLDADTIKRDSDSEKIHINVPVNKFTSSTFTTNSKYGIFTVSGNPDGNFVSVNGVIMPVIEIKDSSSTSGAKDIYVGFSGGDFPIADSSGNYNIKIFDLKVHKIPGDDLNLKYDSKLGKYFMDTELQIAPNDLISFENENGKILYQLEVLDYDRRTGEIKFKYPGDLDTTSDHSYGAAVIRNFASEKIYEDAIYIDTSHQSEIIEVDTDNVSNLGPDDPRNPLGFAARMALEGVLKVYAIAVAPDSDNNLDFVNGPQGLVHAHPEYSIISYHILHPDHDKDWKGFIQGLAKKDQMRWAVLPVYNRIPDAEEKLYANAKAIVDNSYQLTAQDENGVYITDLQIGDYFYYNVTNTDNNTTTTEQAKITGIIDAVHGVYLCDKANINGGSSNTPITVTYYRPHSNTERAQIAADQASGYASTWIWPFVNPVEYNFKGDTVYLDPGYLALMHFKTYTAYPIRRPWRGKTITKFEKALLSNNEFSLEEIELMQSGGNTVYENIGAGNIYTIDGLTSDMSADARLYQSSVMQTIYFLYLLKSYTQNITIKYGYLSTDRERVVKAVFSAALKDALNRSEPLVKFGTGIDSLELEGETGVSLKIIVETEKGFNYLDVLVTVE